MTSDLLRVVVVDDVDDVRALMSAALTADGRFELVGVAQDASQAIEVVRDTSPDLVLLDLAMPGGDGLTALPRIRRECPTAQVVILSGFPRGRLEDLTVASGAVGYVEKGRSVKRTISDVLAVAGIVSTLSETLRNTASLPNDPASSAAARRFMEDTLERWDAADLVDTVNLLVSELVTNVVMHARTEADVAVLLTATSLRVEVGDRSDSPPVPRDAGDEATSGRGMALVEALSTGWGVTRTEGGKTIWFELSRPEP